MGAGLDWIGLDWIGLDRIGLDRGVYIWMIYELSRVLLIQHIANRILFVYRSIYSV